MTINSIMGKPLKHYAIDKTTNARYIMLALENDTDKNTCSVVDMDALDSDLRAELTEIINSDECQRVVDPWKVLDTKFFMNYPKQTILSALRAMHIIKVVDSDNVLIQMPGNQTQTPKQVMECIREYQKSKAEKKLNGTQDKLSSAMEDKNAEEIKELKEQVATLTSSVASLIEALKSKKK